MKAAVSLAGLYPLYNRDFERLLDTVRMMDEAGIDQLVASEHVLMSERLDQYPYGEMPAPIDFDWFDPLVLLSAVATVTRRVRLSTGILVAPLRPAAILAKELSTLDHLSRGRVDIGVGVGWQTAEFDACGVPFEGRFGRLEEVIRICQTLWRDAPASFSGKSASFDRVWSVPLPVQEGGIPVWFGLALSDRNLARIVELGQGWLPYYGIAIQPSDLTQTRDDARPMFTMERFAQDMARLRQACEERGRDPSTMGVRIMIPTQFGPGGRPDLERTLEQIPALEQTGATIFEISPMLFCRALDEIEPFVRRVVHACR